MGLESELMTAKEAAEQWGITTRRVQYLCDNGQVDGAIRMGRTWIIPKGTPKPIDGRTKAAKLAAANKTAYKEQE
jgi:FMN phosphatase YigB (HAD superfamily)